MIVGLILIQSLQLLSYLPTLDVNLSLKPITSRSPEPLRTKMETKYLLIDYGSVVKHRQPNKWERLVLALKKSGDLSE